MKKWPSNSEEAAIVRDRLAARITIASSVGEKRVIAGVDAAYRDDTVVAAAALYDLDNLFIVEQATATMEIEFPYVPGYLFFREGPAVISALGKLCRRPDLIMTDGHGIAHANKAGYACLLGVMLGIPTIGCAKTRLIGNFEDPSLERGAYSPLIYLGETVGSVVRTRTGIRPLFVSPGHLVTIEEAVAIVLQCSVKYRIPEPIRAAHALAGRLAKQKNCLDGSERGGGI